MDPIARTLEVLRLVRPPGARSTSQWMLIETFGESAVVRAEPFDAIDVKLARLWGE